MDLVRNILRSIEQNQEMDGSRDFFISEPEDVGGSGYSIEEVLYHLDLLISGGFVNGANIGHVVRGLTWEGHEFLDNIKSDGIWAKTKTRLSDLPGVALKIVAEVATSEVRKHLGLP